MHHSADSQRHIAERDEESTGFACGSAGRTLAQETPIFSQCQKTKREGEGIAGWEAKQSTAQIKQKKKGSSKLVPWCLKAGVGRKTHSHPLIPSMTDKQKKKPLDPKIKGGAGFTDQGGIKMYRKWPKERKKAHTETLNTDFSIQTETTESQPMVSTPWNKQPSEQENLRNEGLRSKTLHL